jgi:hypothetical protein
MLGATPLFSVSWDNHTGLARIDWAPSAVCGIEDARDVDREIEALSQGAVRCLVTPARVFTVEHEAASWLRRQP